MAESRSLLITNLVTRSSRSMKIFAEGFLRLCEVYLRSGRSEGCLRL